MERSPFHTLLYGFGGDLLSSALSSMNGRQTSDFRIATSDGSEWRFDDSLDQVDELGLAVYTVTQPLILRAAVAALGQGRQVDFGAVSIRPDTIAFGGRTVSHNAPQALHLSEKHLELVMFDGSKASVARNTIANMYALVALVDLMPTDSIAFDRSVVQGTQSPEPAHQAEQHSFPGGAS